MVNRQHRSPMTVLQKLPNPLDRTDHKWSRSRTRFLELKEKCGVLTDTPALDLVSSSSLALSSESKQPEAEGTQTGSKPCQELEKMGGDDEDDSDGDQLVVLGSELKDVGR